jgi:aryl-alcohol dehydrogenase-like predicted oxidoreductase
MAARTTAASTFFDNAEVYAKGESETLMGEALRKLGWRARRISSQPSSTGA